MMLRKLSIVVGSLLTMLLVTIASAQSNSITLTWCPSPTPINVVGYDILYAKSTNIISWTPRIYSSNTPCSGVIISNGSNWYRNYNMRINVGNTNSYVFTNLTQGYTYYFTMISYNGLGMTSDYSEEIKYTVPFIQSNLPPSQPQNFQFSDVK